MLTVDRESIDKKVLTTQNMRFIQNILSNEDDKLDGSHLPQSQMGDLLDLGMEEERKGYGNEDMLISQTASEEQNLAESLGILENLKPVHAGNIYDFADNDEGTFEGQPPVRSESPLLGDNRMADD